MKKYKPTTPSRRRFSTISFRSALTASEPLKSLTKGGARSVGRNSAGRVTMRHKGGGHKRLLRAVDFEYKKRDIPAVIESIEYDPNRSAFIGRALYRDGARSYVVLPSSMKVGDAFTVSEKAELKPGNRLPLAKIPVGTFVYNVELKPGGGARIARSAGVFAEVVAHDGGYAHIKMPSTEIRKIIDTAWASVGAVSNEEHRLRIIGKAGRSRWMGIRPTVRGSAMNPVDHPHGGGEGRQGRGRRRAVSLWGRPTGKGQKTRRPKKYSNHLILSRRISKKKESETQ